MTRGILYFVVLASMITLSALVPAYAEVTSLNTNSKFYKGGSSITFSGTVLSTDPPSVTILIFDPNNKFVTLTSAMADSSHSFQAVFDTSASANQNLLTLKGVYNATAFIANKTNGKTVTFVFSPDGSSVTPSPPTNLTATASSSTEIDLNWLPPQNNNGFPISGYQIERNDGNGFNVITKSQTTTYRDISLIPNSEHSYRVSAINSGGTSSPSNIAIKSTLLTPAPVTPPQTTPSTPDSSTTQSLQDIINERIAAGNKIKELSHTKSVTHNVTLSEKVGLDDASDNKASQKSESIPQNNLQSINFTNFDIKNILYPAISLVGVGVVVIILYLRKKRKLTDSTSKIKTSTLPPVEPASEEKDDDYAMAILKNRLAKGEITIDVFKTIKDELSEP